MADEAARSLFIDIDWNIEGKKLDDANKSTDKMKTNAEDIAKQTKASAKTVTTAADKMSKDYKKTGKSAEGAADDVEEIGSKSKKSGDEVEKLSKKGDGLKKAFAGAALGIAAGIGAVGAMALDAGKKQQEYFKTISLGTGASGEQLDGLMESFKNVGKNADNDLGAVSVVIADVNTKLGFQGEALEAYTNRILDLGDVTGDSFDSLTDGAAKMAQSWKLTEAESIDSLDKLFVASQKTGLGIDQITGSVTKFGPQLRELGYDLDHSIALVSSWDKAGLDGNKMLMSMQKATMKLSNEGVTDLNAGMIDIYSNIKNATSAEAANAIAMENFGASGLAMADAIRTGKFEVDELATALANSKDAIGDAAEATETFDDKLNKFKNQIHFALEPIGGQMLDTLGTVLDNVVPLLEPIVANVGKVMETISPLIADVLSNVGPFIEDSFGLLSEVLPIVVDLLGSTMKLVGPLIRSLVTIGKQVLPVIIDAVGKVAGVFDMLIPLLVPLIDKIMPPLTDLISIAASLFTTLVDAVMPLISSILPPLVDLLGVLFETVLPVGIEIIRFFADILTGSLGGALTSITDLVGNVIGIFEGLIDFITAVFAGDWGAAWQAIVDIFGNIFGGIQNLFKIPINWVIGGINKFLEGLSGIKIPDWVPIVGGKEFSITPIPLLAEGTDWFPGGKAIVGEQGPELVSLPRGAKVTPNSETQRILDRTQSVNSQGDTITNDVEMIFEIDARGADESAIDRLRTELRNEMPKAIEKAFKKLYLKNKPNGQTVPKPA